VPGTPPVTIRRAQLRDAAALAALGERTFRDTYTEFNTPGDMNLYVSENFSEAVIARELVDPRVTYLLGASGESEGRSPSRGLGGDAPESTAWPIAYAKLFEGAPPPCVSGPKPIELARLYVAKEWHGTGVARVLMNACFVEAGRLDAKTLWLGVWEKNGRARSFYSKHGFEDVGEHEFLLGKDAQRDRVLVAPIRVRPGSE
jgi:ribosomal protein S18 acetylase RimI-like enzyme